MTVNRPQTFRGLDEDATVRAILEGTATKTGNRFFAALVENLSKCETEIRKSEEKYRRIVETAGEGFILMDKHLVITDVNEAFCRQVGKRREEIIGKTPLDFAGQDFHQFLAAHKKEIFSGLYKDFEGTLAVTNGHDVPILVHGNALRDDQGETIGNMAFVTNMTAQKKSLALAAEVQKNLQPRKNFKVQGLDIAGRTIACDEIGGDYFDFLQEPACGKHHFDAVVGDVTGHGVDAALLMTTARAFLRMRASQCGSISQIVTEMNRRLTTDFSGTGHFMTLLYMSIDTQNLNLRWIRAGHDPAVVYDPDYDRFEELTGTGIALGVDPGFAYEEYLKTGLRRGQIIAIGTDGIWEACNADGQMFGKQRFRDILRENAQLSADEIIDAVYEELNHFKPGLKQADDITLVVIKLTDISGVGDDWQI